MEGPYPDLQTRFEALDPQPTEEYNFDHFRATHLLVDGLLTLRAHGIQPGGGSGVVLGGFDRGPRFFAAITNGWPALRGGVPQSYTDLELAAPGSATSVWLGDQLKPLLAPIALRAKPLPRAARAALAIGALGVLLADARVRRVRSAPSPQPTPRT